MTYQSPPYPQQPQHPASGPPYGQPQPPFVPGQAAPPPQAYGTPAPGYGPPAQGYAPGPTGFLPPPAPKKPSNTRAILIVVGALVALCVFGAVGAAFTGGSEPKAKVKAPVAAATTKAADEAKPADKQDTPDTYNVALGSTITITGGDGSEAEGTIKSAKTYKKACNSFLPDPENGVFVVVDVVVRQTKGSGTVNPLDFTFVAEDGTTANSLSAAFSGCDEPSLDSTNSLRQGQKRAGKIAFDATSSKGTVEWAPGGLGSESVGSWKVG